MNTTPVVLGRCTQSNRVETLGWRHGIFLGSNMVRGFELKIFARNRSQSVSRLSECFRNRLNTQERSFWIKEEKTLVRGVYRQEKRKNKKWEFPATWKWLNSNLPNRLSSCVIATRDSQFWKFYTNILLWASDRPWKTCIWEKLFTSKIKRERRSRTIALVTWKMPKLAQILEQQSSGRYPATRASFCLLLEWGGEKEALPEWRQDFKVPQPKLLV